MSDQQQTGQFAEQSNENRPPPTSNGSVIGAANADSDPRLVRKSSSLSSEVFGVSSCLVNPFVKLATF